LGTGGHLTALRRTAVGGYDIAQARTLDQLAEKFTVTPIAEAAAAAFPRVDLTVEQATRLCRAAPLPVREVPLPEAAQPAARAAERPLGPAGAGADVPLAAFAPDDTLVALVTASSGRLRSLAVFTA